MGPDGYKFVGPKTITEKKDKMPKNDTHSFYLREDFGCGGDGRVWKACTETGCVCVIKFTLKESSNEESEARRRRLKGEHDLWVTIWDEHRVRLIQLNHEPALIMPFASPMPEAKQETKETGQLPKSVLKALETMANKGYEHADLKWRHVGLVKYRERRKAKEYVVLFDLMRVDRRNKAEKAAAVKRMIDTLVGEAKE